MAMTQLTCPECHTVLRTSADVRPGTSVRCPHCQVRFSVPFSEEDELPEVRPVLDERAATNRPRRPRDRDDDFEDEEPVRRRRPRGRDRFGRRQGNSGLVVGIIIGGICLFVLAAAAIPLLLWLRSSKELMLVGTWQSNPNVVSLEFKSDHTCVWRMGNMVVQTAIYRLVGSDTLELELPNPAQGLGRQGIVQAPPGMPRFEWNSTNLKVNVKVVSLTREELVLQNSNGTTQRFSRAGS